MKINWKVRFKNKNFWIAAIPAMLLLLQQVTEIFGVSLDLSTIQGQILSVVETVFLLLALIGIVNDPTTQGLLSDSANALTYTEPKAKEAPIDASREVFIDATEDELADVTDEEKGADL